MACFLQALFCWICLCCANGQHIFAQEGLLHKALLAQQEQRTADAQVLLAAVPADGSDLDRWLRFRVALDVGNHEQARVMAELIREIPESELNIQWRGAYAQLCGEYYFKQQKFQTAEPQFVRALKYGGIYVQDEVNVFHLMRIYVESKQADKTMRLARILWYGNFNQEKKMRAGLIYAAAIKNDAPNEARHILSDIRLMDGCPADIYIQASELLITLLVPRQVEQAKRIVDEALNRAANEDRERIQIWQSIIVFHIDREQGYKLMEAFDVQEYPVLLPYKQLGDREAKRDIQQLCAEAKKAILAGNQTRALTLIGEHYHTHAEALLLALEANLPLELALKSSCRYDAMPAVPIFLRLHEINPTAGHDFLKSAFTVLEKRSQWADADLSLIVLAFQYLTITDKQHALIEKNLQLVSRKHAALGMWYCQQAQVSQREHSREVAEQWQRALLFLPLEHDWFVVAAEQLALSVLEPVSPGTVLDRPAKSQLASLDALIDSLSFVAWSGQADQHLKCRYLLAQALSQRGRTGEARLCFESLAEVGGLSRKDKIIKALQNLERASQGQVDDLRP